MIELIDKKETVRRLKAAYDGRVAGLRDKDDLFAEGIERTLDFAAGIEYAMGIIGNIKAVDVVPVIRCRDCSYAEKAEWRVLPMVHCTHPKMGGYGAARTTDDYCSYGERKGENNGKTIHKN